MTLNEISYKILESIRHEIGSDEQVDLREIKHDILNIRSRMIRTELQKNRPIGNKFIQSLGCIPVSMISASACCVGLGNCHLLRSDDKLPSSVSLRDRSMLTRIGPANIMSTSYSLINYDDASSVGYGRFNSILVFAFILENYLYLIQRAGTPEYKGLQVVNVMGVFDDPEIVRQFNDCDGNDCYTDDTEFPIERWMLDDIETRIIQKYIELERATSEDNSLDSDNNLDQQKGK